MPAWSISPGARSSASAAIPAAVLTNHTALPHPRGGARRRLMAAVIGSLLILPVLRTYGHYAALITIASAYFSACS